MDVLIYVWLSRKLSILLQCNISIYRVVDVDISPKDLYCLDVVHLKRI